MVGPDWVFAIKLDGYRAIAVKADGRVNLFSRRHKSFNHQYPYVVEALDELPEGTVVNEEIAALDESVLSTRQPDEHFEVSANDMLAAARQQGLERVIAKRKDSLYQDGTMFEGCGDHRKFRDKVYASLPVP